MIRSVHLLALLHLLSITTLPTATWRRLGFHRRFPKLQKQHGTRNQQCRSVPQHQRQAHVPKDPEGRRHSNWGCVGGREYSAHSDAGTGCVVHRKRIVIAGDRISQGAGVYLRQTFLHEDNNITPKMKLGLGMCMMNFKGMSYFCYIIQ